MSLLPGVLSDSYRRQLRHIGSTLPVDVILPKINLLQTELGIERIGLDIGIRQLGPTDEVSLSKLRNRFETGGIRPTVILSTVSLHADRQVWEPALRRAIQDLEIAGGLGASIAMFFFDSPGRVTREGRISRAVERLSTLAASASNRGIRLATENYDYFNSVDFIRIFDGVGKDRVGLNNDVGNWLILGEDPVEATREMSAYTIHSHIRDYVLTEGVYRSVPVGTGSVPIDSVLKTLAEVGGAQPHFTFSVEMDLDSGNSNDEDMAVRSSLEYVNRWIQKHAAQERS